MKDFETKQKRLMKAVKEIYGKDAEVKISVTLKDGNSMDFKFDNMTPESKEIMDDMQKLMDKAIKEF